MLTQDNPLPAVMGRVCYHPCETACNRAQLDAAVGINSVERFLGDAAIRQGWQQFAKPAAESGKRVLVVGAGPSGLSAAYQLRRLGHEVEIFEAGRSGRHDALRDPKYRLPRDVLDAEIARILDLGIALRLNVKITNILEAMTKHGFDAAFLAVGAHIAKRAYIPAGEAAKILDAVQVLRSMEARKNRCSGAASSFTAAAIPRSTSPAPPSASARPRRSSSIAARAIACLRTISSSKRRSRKA